MHYKNTDTTEFTYIYIHEVIQKMYRHHPHHMIKSGFCLKLIFYLSFTSFSKHNLDYRGNNASHLKQD